MEPLSGILRYHLAAALLLCVLLHGCYPAPKAPIDTVRYEAGDRNGPRLLFVYLPGRGDPITAFQREGLLAAVRERGMNADVVAVNAHLGYYLDGSVITRLNEDVIGPARAVHAYEQIWFIGNSLGGFGALSYVREHPEEVTGVLLLGPYLGEKQVIQDIKQAGGLERWEPGDITTVRSQENAEKLVWVWIRDHARKNLIGTAPEGCAAGMMCIPSIYLGYGLSDRFAYSHEYLAALLPPGHVIARKGGHDWTTWKKLFNQFLDQDIFKP